MASIFTGLAFMHGHIVNRELVLSLGAAETPPAQGGKGARADKPASNASRRAKHEAAPLIATPGCAGGACC
ncbi:hypothetical protein KPL74_19325 [Bacillus sp. NP157]|nr:hypothetical protein KPL74_19325 [Bacillus sp. NP157]